MSSEVVWVDSWQQECCGDHFAVGSTVEWELAGVDAAVREDLVSRLGTEFGARITCTEERHEEDESRTQRRRGVVRSIVAVTCTLRRVARDGEQFLDPVPGSWEFTSIGDVDDAVALLPEPEPMTELPPDAVPVQGGWFMVPSLDEMQDRTGYVVELELTD